MVARVGHSVAPCPVAVVTAVANISSCLSVIVYLCWGHVLRYFALLLYTSMYLDDDSLLPSPCSLRFGFGLLSSNRSINGRTLRRPLSSRSWRCSLTTVHGGKTHGPLSQCPSHQNSRQPIQTYPQSVDVVANGGHGGPLVSGPDRW